VTFRRKSVLWLGVLVALMLIVGGCGSKAAPPKASAPTKAPAATSAQVPAKASGGEVMVEGKPIAEFYADACAPCHGADRKGTDNGPALLPQNLTKDDQTYFDIIKNGKEGMPPLGGQEKLTDEEIQALVEYLKSKP